MKIKHCLMSVNHDHKQTAVNVITVQPTSVKHHPLSLHTKIFCIRHACRVTSQLADKAIRGKSICTLNNSLNLSLI